MDTAGARGDRKLLVYGANGYTGRLLLEALRARGIPCVVAGRDAAAIDAVRRELEPPGRAFGLDDPATVDRGLAGVGVVLNAAGPFAATSRPLVDACLRRGAHYLDLSAELDAIADVAARHDEARRRGVMLLPAVGFDVFASDCLAVHLARQLPSAHRLVLGIGATALLSRGSGLTFAAAAGRVQRVRREGRLVALGESSQFRWLDFGAGERPAVLVSWGDLVTAHASTGIPNIEVYFEGTAERLLGWTMHRQLGPALTTRWTRSWMDAAARRLPAGPSPAARARERGLVVGEVTDGRTSIVARLHTPDVYTFSGLAGAEAAARVLEGAARPGFSTPGQLFGPDSVLALPGVVREDR